MGLYLEPGIDKKQWLEDNATPITGIVFGTAEIKMDDVPDDKVIVCLVDNGPFYAAGIAYDDRELQAFNHDDDPRAKIWFYLDKELAKATAPEWDKYIKE